MRRFEIDADASPHRRVGGVNPFVPGAVHLPLPLHVGDVDDRRENLALVGAAQREALVDAMERLDALLVHRGGYWIGRNRHGENEVVVHDGAAASRRQAWKALDHGCLPPSIYFAITGIRVRHRSLPATPSRSRSALRILTPAPRIASGPCFAQIRVAISRTSATAVNAARMHRPCRWHADRCR